MDYCKLNMPSIKYFRKLNRQKRKLAELPFETLMPNPFLIHQKYQSHLTTHTSANFSTLNTSQL
uniref:Ovule protein n=1 Tax=Mesocestoides corti TaxID=53468 RepID=A0A5K3ENZ3_MESCO